MTCGALSHALEVVSAAAFPPAGAGRGALLVLTRRDSVNELLPGAVDAVAPERITVRLANREDWVPLV